MLNRWIKSLRIPNLYSNINSRKAVNFKFRFLFPVVNSPSTGSVERRVRKSYPYSRSNPTLQLADCHFVHAKCTRLPKDICFFFSRQILTGKSRYASREIIVLVMIGRNFISREHFFTVHDNLWKQSTLILFLSETQCFTTREKPQEVSTSR